MSGKMTTPSHPAILAKMFFNSSSLMIYTCFILALILISVGSFVYFRSRQRRPPEPPVISPRKDQALGAAGAWLKHVNDMYRGWIQRARPRMGTDGIWIEKPAMGLRLLEIAQLAAGRNAYSGREDEDDGDAGDHLSFPFQRLICALTWAGAVPP